MNGGKYIIIEERGHEVPILFHPLISHSKMGQDKIVVSAGFFVVKTNPYRSIGIDVTTFGDSIGLKCKSRPNDKTSIKKLLTE